MPIHFGYFADIWPFFISRKTMGLPHFGYVWQFLKNMKEFKQYLRDNLTLMIDDAGQKYYSCGYDHTLLAEVPGPRWDPYRLLKKFCAEKKIYWKEFFENIELDCLRKFRCECEYANLGLEEEN